MLLAVLYQLICLKHIDEAVRSAASELKRAGSNGVVVTGIQDVNAQTVALEINEFLKVKHLTLLLQLKQDKVMMQLFLL